MARPELIRQEHFKAFASLALEERLKWALSAGHTLRQRMSLQARRGADRLRNAFKKKKLKPRRSLYPA